MSTTAHRYGHGRPSLLGVLYAEDFADAEEVVAAGGDDPLPEPELIEPSFTAIELEAARAEGRAAGMAEAEHGLAGARNRLLALLAEGVAASRTEARAAAEDAAEAVARVVLTALAACLPTLCERHGAAELQALARRLLPALADEPAVTVRVHPHMEAAMRAEIDRLEPDLAGRMTLLAVDAIPPGDVRIGWAGGSATRNAARVRGALEEGLGALGLLHRECADA